MRSTAARTLTGCSANRLMQRFFSLQQVAVQRNGGGAREDLVTEPYRGVHFLNFRHDRTHRRNAEHIIVIAQIADERFDGRQRRQRVSGASFF